MAIEKPRTSDAAESRVNDGRRRVGLLTLGSAAVLIIYSAGFVRTRAAASRVADSEAARHPEYRRATLPERATVPSVADAPSSQASDVGITVPMLRGRTRASTASANATAMAPSPGNADSTNLVVTQSVATTSPTATTENAPEPVSSPAEAQSQPATATPPPSQGQYKDGSYAGWGTSRHGDIEATVEIKAGRIVSADITQCRTRYSCSRIASLPPQVLAKQSPEVDYVSGATQSSDAYYYAVVEALKKAK